MGRFKQKSDGKGSLKLIQTLVNNHPHILNSKLSHIVGERISWVSPLYTDEYAEYRDKAFLEKLGVDTEIAKNLKKFWPRNGPQWDALGKFGENGVILVEAKANLPELGSPRSFASSPISRELIVQSLEETREYISADSEADWTGTYYQYLNRIAHLYFLRVLHNVPTYLVMLYFIGDKTTGGPSFQEEWESAIEKMHQSLGIPNNHRLEDYIVDIFIHTDELK
ncbi:hypothetical protein ABET41_10485 [Metabacillus fastidiosus]|uniref:Uncharacterized protein n=1 Tax=Metabacillus fastidiosus TaxID=1458 RepID=A0ABU6NSD5_9BACI|nr:hypothetical protein [Metabacillus fastidiosus]MED4399989.1 hypothetical protein [Metabacillus fastidiosus]MED4462473.1 hypothetical protein [Metabacillus fastidiosus]